MNAARSLEKESYSYIFVNGNVVSTDPSLPQEVIVCSLSQAATTYPSLLKSPLFVDIEQEGLFLYIPKHCAMMPFIHIVCQHHPHSLPYSHVIMADEHSQATVVVEYRSLNDEAYAIHTNTIIHTQKNSHLEYYKFQFENQQACHKAKLTIKQEQQSYFKAGFIASGCAQMEEKCRLTQVGEQAECCLYGLNQLKGEKQVFLQEVQVEHQAVHGKSLMHYKSIVDHHSEMRFKGKVLVQPTATQINAQQISRHLLLSNQAIAATKPELEIYADDVKCSHGATVGQLDAEALFYLRSRGIVKEQALAILTHAFAKEIIDVLPQNIREIKGDQDAEL